MTALIRIAAALVILPLVAVTSASAQSWKLEARIRFEFAAGQTVLPAGTYSVSTLGNSPNVLLVRGAKGGVMLMGERAGTPAGRKDVRLVFHRYGARYFLRQVWFAGDGGFTLPETPEERRYAERADRTALSLVTVTAP